MSRLVIMSGNGQITRAGEQFPAPCVVQVLDENSVPLKGVRVSFSIRGSTRAQFPGSTQVVTITDRHGKAASPPIRPWEAGTVVVHAFSIAVGAAPVDFQLTSEAAR